MAYRSELPQFRGDVHGHQIDVHSFDVDRAHQCRTVAACVSRDAADGKLAARAYWKPRADRDLPPPFAGDVVPRSEAAECQRGKFERFDAVTVVGQVVEHTVAVVPAKRLDHDHEIGIEAAHDLRDIEPFPAEGTEAADAPVGVERGEGEIGQTISVSENEGAQMPPLRCRSVVPTIRGDTSGRRGRSRSSWRA